jgi:hypothetical protein
MTVSQLAFKDIAKEGKRLQQVNGGGGGCRVEVWFVTSTHLNTKEQRALNRELGIHKLNKARL